MIMNNKCIYLKQKLNRKLECKKTKNEITLKDCANCTLKEYKCTVKPNSMCKKTKKQNKLERNRYSIFTKDLTRCIICGKSPINKHEIFGGRNRIKSIEYGLVIPLCTAEHHNQVEMKGIHFDKGLQDEWHKKGQVIFNKTYPELDFVDIFKNNYLNK